MGSDEEKQLSSIKAEFSKELDAIADIDRLKEFYALELAKRDKIIDDLQKQNRLLLKTAFKTRSEDIKS